jgi:hypothetical protein
MPVKMPVAELDAGFSSRGAPPTDWAEGRRHIDEAEVFWISTVRPDGRPHVTPLLAVSMSWSKDAPSRSAMQRSSNQVSTVRWVTPVRWWRDE